MQNFSRMRVPPKAASASSETAQSAGRLATHATVTRVSSVSSERGGAARHYGSANG